MQIAAYEKVIFNLAQELSAEKASHAETKALAEKNSAEQAAKLAENEKKITTLEKQALIAARDVAQLKDAWEWSEREARSFESELENLRGY
jgi:molecular chaperone GrpE (heat shock protein)